MVYIYVIKYRFLRENQQFPKSGILAPYWLPTRGGPEAPNGVAQRAPSQAFRTFNFYKSIFSGGPEAPSQAFSQAYKSYTMHNLQYIHPPH